MKQYEWQTFEKLKLNPNIEYINGCCKFCDLILEKVKDGICEEMNVDSSEILIGQEDWGWFLEFRQNDFFYDLNIGYLENIDGNESDSRSFSVTVEVKKLKKGFFFNRKIEAKEKLDEFTKKVERIAESNQIEVFEE